MCLNYSILFSNVPRLQSFLLDNSDILRIDYKAHIMWITLTAMICPLGLCTILLTDPYAPLPISPRSLRSSAVKSQCCSGEIFSPEDSMLCVRIRSLKRMSQCFYTQKLHHQTELQKLWLLLNRFPELCPSVIGWKTDRPAPKLMPLADWIVRTQTAVFEPVFTNYLLFSLHIQHKNDTCAL